MSSDQGVIGMIANQRKQRTTKCSPIGPIVNNFTDYIKSGNNSRNISQRSDSDRDKKPKSDFTQVFYKIKSQFLGVT